jgi:hypothetical protein
MNSDDALSKADIVRKIFLEESFVENSNIEESAIYLQRQNYLDLSNLLMIINGFFELNLQEQIAYFKVLPQILNTLTIIHLPSFLDKIYNPAVEAAFIEAHYDLYLLLLENSPLIMQFLKDSRFQVSKRNTIANFETYDLNSRMTSGTGVFSSNLEEPFKLSILEIVIKMLKFKEKANSERFSIAFGLFSDCLSSFDNDNKLLFVILSILHDQSDQDNPIFALGLVEKIVKNCSANFIEGFVAIDILSLIQSPNADQRKAAYLCFMSMLPIFRPDFLQKKFATTIEQMAIHKENDVKLVFLTNVKPITEKLKLDFIREKLLLPYTKMLKDNNKHVRGRAFYQLGSFIITLLDKMENFFNPPIECLSEALSIYFCLHVASETIDLKSRQKIISHNYESLPSIMRLFSKRMWPQLRSLLISIDDYSNGEVVEITKLVLSRQLGEIATILGTDIVEKELISIVHLKFLTLGLKTSQMVKLKTIEQLSTILKVTSPATRKIFVDYYIALQDDTKKWRVRASICSQLQDLVALFEPIDIVSFISPMFFVFCKDECALVRKLSCTRFHVIIKALRVVNDPNIFILTENMKDFATRPKFYLRLSYIALFESLYFNCNSEIDNEMRQLMEGLLSDPVISVKIRLSLFVVEAERQLKYDKLTESLRISLMAVQNLDVQIILQTKKPGLEIRDRNVASMKSDELFEENPSEHKRLFSTGFL